MSEEPIFFAAPEEFRAWLKEYHAREEVQWVGYYKVATGKDSMTWEESVEEALCFGWIDGLRKSIDEERYMIRFTPRRPGSNWSQKNIESVEKLIAAGRMQAAGLKAYEARQEDKSGTYSFEQDKEPALSAGLEEEFKAEKEAWEFFQAQPPGYRRTVIHWIASAKQEKTRVKRLRRTIEVSADEKRVDLMSPYKRTK